MLVSQIIEQALALLNYTDSSGHIGSSATHAVTARGLFAVRQIYRDLYFALWPRSIPERRITVGDTAHPDRVPSDAPPPYRDLFSANDPVPLPERLCADVMPYGVAMLLAQGEGDADNQAAFSLIYNQKRSALTHTDERINVLP